MGLFTICVLYQKLCWNKGRVLLCGSYSGTDYLKSREQKQRVYEFWKSLKFKWSEETMAVVRWQVSCSLTWLLISSGLFCNREFCSRHPTFNHLHHALTPQLTGSTDPVGQLLFKICLLHMRTAMFSQNVQGQNCDHCYGNLTRNYLCHCPTSKNRRNVPITTRK